MDELSGTQENPDEICAHRGAPRGMSCASGSDPADTSAGSPAGAQLERLLTMGAPVKTSQGEQYHPGGEKRTANVPGASGSDPAGTLEGRPAGARHDQIRPMYYPVGGS